MSEMKLQDLSEQMRDIDFGMLSTRTAGGAMASRPMSNNGEVEYTGDSYFFSYDGARTIGDIRDDPRVGLTFTGKAGLLGKPPLFIAIEGEAELIREKAEFEAHWVDELERWFDRGIDTPGMVLIKVHAGRIRYWDGEADGEIVL